MGGGCVRHVISPRGIHWFTISTNAKDVKSFMSSNNTPAEEVSAPDVAQRFHLVPDVSVQYNEVKCGQCSTVTPHEWFMLKVENDPALQPMEPLELLGKQRRVVMCQNCGNLRLIK